MNAYPSSAEICLVVTQADAVELAEELTKRGIPFEQERREGESVLGYDLASLVQIVITGGAFTALSGVLVAYLKHRRRAVHIRRNDGRVDLRTENLGTEEIKDILASVDGKDQMWLLEQAQQRAVKTARAKAKRSPADESKPSTKPRTAKRKTAKRVTKPAKATKKKKKKKSAAGSDTNKKRAARKSSR